MLHRVGILLPSSSGSPILYRSSILYMCDLPIYILLLVYVHSEKYIYNNLVVLQLGDLSRNTFRRSIVMLHASLK